MDLNTFTGQIVPFQNPRSNAILNLVVLGRLIFGRIHIWVIADLRENSLVNFFRPKWISIITNRFPGVYYVGNGGWNVKICSKLIIQVDFQ